MDLSALIDFCKDKYPEKSIEICEGIDLVIDTLNGIKSDMGKSVSDLFGNDEFDTDSVDEYKNHAKQIINIIKYLNKISNDIALDNVDDNEIGDENISSDSKAFEVNYNDKSFNVDSSIPHTVYEDFTYTKPSGIEIENTYLEANEWRDIFNKCCQYLLKKNRSIFMSFLDDKSMQGRSRKYFSLDKTELREGELITGSNIYIECNVNAIFVRNIIVKMLEKFEIPKRNCHFFIRRDLTSLHNNGISVKTQEKIIKKIQESNDEVKIGQYAKEYFAFYFQKQISEEELNRFTNKDWCHDTFGICYPILKQVDIKLPISEQVNYNNQYRRYYSNPVLNINGSNYIICSRWYAESKSKLIDWIKNNGQKPNNNSTSFEKANIVKLGKEYCGIALPVSLFVFILKTIEQYQNTQFETGKLSLSLADIITKQTNYVKPQHVINNVRKYLEDQNIIALCENCKKGKYQIVDIESLKQLIEQYSQTPNINNDKNTVSYNSKVTVYSYYNKQQIILNVGNIEDEFVYLHDECVGRKAGDKFNFNSKEYVIVSFKNNID